MTEFFCDADNGLDANDGLAIGTAYKTFDAFCNAARSAGDFLTIRGGMTATYQLASPADLIFTSDGTVPAPIRMEADYDDQFSDHVDLAVAGPTETATLAIGDKDWVYTDTVAADVAAGDVLYASGDDPREFGYEVESVSTSTVTMYLPYKGAQAGSGKTTINMQGIPIWGTVAGDFQVNLDTDNYWMFQGVKFRGTDSAGVFEIDGSASPVFRDCAFEANGTSATAMRHADDWVPTVLVKCRFLDYTIGFDSSAGLGGFVGEARDCLFDGNSATSSVAVKVNTGVDGRFVGCEFKNHAAGDFDYGTSITSSGIVRLRNCILASTTEFDEINTSLYGRAFVEDHDGEPGDTRQLSYLSSGEAVPVIQSDTGTVRSGGNNISTLVTPSSDFATVQGWEHSRQQLFEHAFYAVADVEKTYTVYFRPTLTADWTTDPLATELFIEADYWGHVTNDVRVIKRSTEVIDMNGSTTWQALTVAVTPAQSGVLYLRGIFSKTPDDTDTFLVDPLPEVA